MGTELQHRLAQADEPIPDSSVLGTMQEAAIGLSIPERLAVRLREVDAQKKTLEAEEKNLKDAIRDLLAEGVKVGSAEIGGEYVMQSRTSATFDYKTAMMDGLFNTEQAKKYMKESASSFPVFKKITREEG